MEKIHFISVYAPDINKSKVEIYNFYKHLQHDIEKSQEHKILIDEEWKNRQYNYRRSETKIQ